MIPFLCFASKSPENEYLEVVDIMDKRRGYILPTPRREVRSSGNLTGEVVMTDGFAGPLHVILLPLFAGMMRIGGPRNELDQSDPACHCLLCWLSPFVARHAFMPSPMHV